MRWNPGFPPPLPSWLQRAQLLGGLSEGTRAAFLAAADAQKREKGRQGVVAHQKLTMTEGEGAGGEVAAQQRLRGSKDRSDGGGEENVCWEEAGPDVSRINGEGVEGGGVGGMGGVDVGKAGAGAVTAEEEEEEARRRDGLMTDVVDQLRFEKEQKAMEVNS